MSLQNKLWGKSDVPDSLADMALHVCNTTPSLLTPAPASRQKESFQEISCFLTQEGQDVQSPYNLRRQELQNLALYWFDRAPYAALPLFLAQGTSVQPQGGTAATVSEESPSKSMSPLQAQTPAQLTPDRDRLHRPFAM